MSVDGVPWGTILIPPKSEWLELTATKESENYQLRYSLEWASPMAQWQRVCLQIWRCWRRGFNPWVGKIL